MRKLQLYFHIHMQLCFHIFLFASVHHCAAFNSWRILYYLFISIFIHSIQKFANIFAYLFKGHTHTHTAASTHIHQQACCCMKSLSIEVVFSSSVEILYSNLCKSRLIQLHESANKSFSVYVCVCLCMCKDLENICLEKLAR